ncbi:MAG: polysaccharide biosynthesis protein [Clostridia bacterium]|nr:polysaccharide biosynthesis protein [Clostridia bacterium]
MAKKTFMQGAVILGVAGIIIKLLGACFRIPLANMIGDEGMGYYQTAYPIYVLFLTLATAGIPIAISRMVSERVAVDNYYGANKVFRVSFFLMFCIGIVSASICFFGAEGLVSIATKSSDVVSGESLNRLNAQYAMKAIAPALFFVPIMAAYRGYFQGMQNMKPTAVSQVSEQLFRVGTGLALAYFLLDYGRAYAAAGASFGATAGSVAGLVTVAGIYFLRKNSFRSDIERTKNHEEESGRRILAKIALIAVPITIGAAIMPIMNFIDVAIVMRRLQAVGYTYEAANGLYGQLTGMAGPLINFPQVLTQAVAMSLVPAVAAAFKQKDTEFLHQNVKLGLRTSIIVGLPCALGLMTLSLPIMKLLYPLQPDSAQSAAPCLFVMAFGVIFLSTVQTLTGVLQGVGKQLIPVRNLAIGALFKIVITYTLTGVYSINVKGAAAGTVVAYMVAATLNTMAVTKYTGAKFDLGLTYLRPALSAVVMAGATYGAYRLAALFLGNAVSTLLAICVAVVVYAFMLFITKSVTLDELAQMPKGTKLVKIIRKFARN